MDSYWLIALVAFLISIVLSIMLFTYYDKPKFNVDTAGTTDPKDGVFENSGLKDEVKKILDKDYKELVPVLKRWQRKAWIFGRIHYFVVTWTTIISITLPFLVQFVGKDWYVTTLVQSASIFSALIFGLHSTFKVKDKYQKYRLMESTIYSTVRKIKTDNKFVEKTLEEIRLWFAEETEKIRAEARSVEIDNIPATISTSKEVAHGG